MVKTGGNGNNILIDIVEKIMKDTQSDMTFEVDSMMVGLIEEEKYNHSGIASEMFTIWKESEDKEAVEKIFLCFTGCNFRDYLKRCIKHTTKKCSTDVHPCL